MAQPPRGLTLMVAENTLVRPSKKVVISVSGLAEAIGAVVEAVGLPAAAGQQYVLTKPGADPAVDPAAALTSLDELGPKAKVMIWPAPAGGETALAGGNMALACGSAEVSGSPATEPAAADPEQSTLTLEAVGGAAEPMPEPERAPEAEVDAIDDTSAAGAADGAVGSAEAAGGTFEQKFLAAPAPALAAAADGGGLVGREGELAGLLAATRAMGSRVLLRGEHGSGKTSLLAEVGRALLAESEGELPIMRAISKVWWLPGQSEEALLFELAAFGRKHGGGGLPNGSSIGGGGLAADSTGQSGVAAALALLATTDDWLLLIDDVSLEAGGRALLARLPAGRGHCVLSSTAEGAVWRGLAVVDTATVLTLSLHHY